MAEDLGKIDEFEPCNPDLMLWEKYMNDNKNVAKHSVEQDIFERYIDDCVEHICNRRWRQDEATAFMRAVEGYTDLTKYEYIGGASWFRQVIFLKYTMLLHKAAKDGNGTGCVGWDSITPELTKTIKEFKERCPLMFVRKLPETMKVNQWPDALAPFDFSSDKCTCHIDTLMTKGCCCGHLHK